MRKLTKTIALVSLMTPTSVLPLGIGDIKLHSTLNQNLDAEIALILAPDENPGDIAVKLAPPDKFDEAGLPWNYFLSKINFKLVSQSGNRAIVKLSSSEVLKEPFLDFLIEVSWPKGTLYREFTVLVDPPATYQQPVLPVPSDYGMTPEAQEYARVVEKPVAPTSSIAERTSDVYGPVGRNETLLSVAAKVRPSSDVSVEQTMIALYQTNPDAFYKDNVNALKAGVRLSVPEREVVLKLSHQQALAEFGRQNRAWRGQVAAKVEKPAAEEVIDSQLTLVAPTQEDVAETEHVVSGDRDDKASSPVVPEQPDEMSAEEPVKDDSEMQTRLEKLEQQLAVMQQMLALKDEQLAALQNRQQIEGVETPKSPETPAATKATPPPRPASKPPKPADTTTEPESSFFDDLYYWLLALVSVGLLGGLGWLWARKRQVEKETDTDSMFAASSQISLPSMDEELNLLSGDDESSYDVGTVGESSFLSEFTPSDFDAFDNEQHEVDPISEADVYLAYGRYQQAEELIRQAIAENPGNDNYKLKLLEIYYANENKEGFDSYANELKQAGKNEDAAFWAKITEMASEISPGSELFSAGFEMSEDAGGDISFKEASQETDDTTGDDSLETDDYDFNLPSFDKAEAGQPDTQEKNVDSEESEGSLDFDLETFDFTEPEPEDKGTEEPKQEQEQDRRFDNEIEFDLNPIKTEPEESKPDAVKSDDIESYDFTSFDTGADQESETGSPNLDLGEFDVSFGEEKIEAEEKSALSESASDDLGFDFDFNFDLDAAPKKTGGDEDFPADLELGVSDLTDMDEFETKIDLARAYIDMGDSDAAKDIATEVLEKGSPEQKKVAQSILDELK